MKKYKLVIENKTKISHVYWANNPWLRLRGLLGRDKLTTEIGLLISPCNSVHTIGIKYSLDIIYLDKDDKVIKIRANLDPWNFSVCKGACKVLELLAGNCKSKNIKQGDELIFVDHKYYS
jgi:uncharacterized membrane protein (UPF0127 family)